MDDWRPVTATEPPEGLVVETCVRGRAGDQMHLPLARSGRTWVLPDGKWHCGLFDPTHWRPLA